RRIAASRQPDRNDCAGNGSRHHRDRRKPAAGHHGSQARHVRDERRESIQERGSRALMMTRTFEPRRSRRHKGTDIAIFVNFVIFVVVAALATNATAQSKDDPSIGSWKLNVAKSTFTPGPPIKADTRSYDVQDGWVIVTTETTAADGTRTGVRFAAKFD